MADYIVLCGPVNSVTNESNHFISNLIIEGQGEVESFNTDADLTGELRRFWDTKAITSL